jgi:hydroxyethylthiazole kinase
VCLLNQFQPDKENAMPSIQTFFHDLELIRERGPLVFSITNAVVTNSTANALLAIGASPLMSHAEEEAEDLVAISNALVINIGTLNRPDIRAMAAAWGAAVAKGIPVVFDPVGAGASGLRTSTSLALLGAAGPTVIRGNGSEILTLAGEAGGAKGVDSTQSTDAALDGARALAQAHGCVVCVSGESDVVTNGAEGYRVFGGDAMMPRVTGLGCTATALCAAFAAVNPDPLQATVHGMAAMAMAGAMAAARAKGPGTLQLHLYDALFALGRDAGELFRIESL